MGMSISDIADQVFAKDQVDYPEKPRMSDFSSDDWAEIVRNHVERKHIKPLNDRVERRVIRTLTLGLVR